MDPLGTGFQSVLLVTVLLQRLLQCAFTYYKATRYPNSWSRSTVRKMKRFKQDTLRWKTISLKSIKVGDIIKLQYCDIAPVDVLILDTSEQRYNENILRTNERKIRGENNFRVKRAIRNLELRTNSYGTVQTGDYLARLCRKLNGYIEYSAPSGAVDGFSGVFKLKNDPIVTNITEDNVLFCGSKLYSKE